MLRGTKLQEMHTHTWNRQSINIFALSDSTLSTSYKMYKIKRYDNAAEQ